ncbi:MAG: hypothetical protein U1E68_05895 [Sphingomonadaceae bacterium]
MDVANWMMSAFKRAIRLLVAFLLACLSASTFAGITAGIEVTILTAVLESKFEFIMMLPFVVAVSAPVGAILGLPSAIIGIGSIVCFEKYYAAMRRRDVWMIAGFLCGSPVALSLGLAWTKDEPLFVRAGFCIALLLAGIVGGLAGHLAWVSNPFLPLQKLDSGNGAVADSEL